MTSRDRPANRKRFRLGRSRPADVPLGQSGADRFAPWIIAPMAYLATLALAAAMAMAGVVDHWETGLTGTITVQIPAGLDATVSDERVARILALLEGMPGISEAQPIPATEVARLLNPWLGDGLLIPDLPLPALIDVQRAAAPPLDLPSLRSAVDRIVPGATVEDSTGWLSDLVALAGLVKLFAAGALGLIALAAIATVISVTNAGLAVHRQVIDILYIMGAPDRYVARQFARHALGLGARGGAIGLALGLVTLVALDQADGNDALLPGISFGMEEWLGLMLVPVVCAVLAMLTALVTVMRALAKLP